MIHVVPMAWAPTYENRFAHAVYGLSVPCGVHRSGPRYSRLVLYWDNLYFSLVVLR